MRSANCRAARTRKSCKLIIALGTIAFCVTNKSSY